MAIYNMTFASRALPTETKVENGTPQSKSGTSVNLSNSALLPVASYVGVRAVFASVGNAQNEG